MKKLIEKFRNLKIWHKLVLFSTMLFMVVGLGMNLWTMYSQHRIAIDQANEFSESIEQIALAGLTTLMVTDTMRFRQVFLSQINESEAVRNLKIMRGEAISRQYGDGFSSEKAETAIEKKVFETGDSYSDIIQYEGSEHLYLIRPIRASRNYLGKNCLSCHQVEEGEILGAISMNISLEQVMKASSGFSLQLNIVGFLIFLFVVTGLYLFSRIFVSVPINRAGQVFQEVAEGNLKVSVYKGHSKETARMMNSLEQMIQHLNSMVHRVREESESLNRQADHLNANASELGRNSEKTLTVAENNVAKLDELRGQLAETAAEMSRISEQSDEVSHKASESGKAVERNVEAMNHISEKIQVVKEIASQTNLLALNATIEAARAGVHGRGFSVVAEEVGKLAETSSKAAAEIIELTDDNIEAAQKASVQIKDLLPQIGETVNKIREMNLTAQKQSEEMQQISAETDILGETARNTSDLSADLTVTAEELARRAAELNKLVQFFKT